METQLESPSIPFTSVPISVPIATASVPLAFGQPEGMTYVTAGPVPTATLSPQHPIYATSAEGLANGGLMTSVHSTMAPVYDTVGHQGDGSSPYHQAGSPLSPMDDRGNPNTKKNAWTTEEDLTLARIVEECGPGRWTKVAQQLPGRMGKQCRERWFNHLAPEVKKGEWTAEEDRLIMTSVRDHGTRWSHIVKLLPGRSDNAIKNRYYSAVRKAHRQDQRLCGDKPMTSVAAASPLAEAAVAAVVSAADEAHALAMGTPPPQLALALPPEEGVAHLQAWQAAQRGVELRHSQPALPSPPPLPHAVAEGGPSPGRPAGRGAKGSPARPKGSPSKRKRKVEAEEEDDDEEAAGAAGAVGAAGAAGAAVTATAVMAQSGWVHGGVVPLQVVQAGWVHGEGGSPDGYDVAQGGLRPAFGSVAEPLGMPSVVCLPDEPMSPDLDASPPRVFENPPEAMPAAAPAAAPIAPHVAPPLVAAAASTPPLVMAELPSTQTVHMSSMHMTHTPLAMHSTQLPPSLASSGGQITLGMPAGYSHSSCAPGPCHSSGYSHGGGATSEGAP